MSDYQLGRYKILEEIGSGGFSTVFRAEDTVLEREVAVKVMQPLLMSDRGFVTRFEREARVAANLEHPHIIPIHDYGEENGRLYLVMKLVKQGSLEQRLRHGPLPFEQVLTIIQQIAAALDYAHQQQVIHRDIKPDNVLLDNDNHAYLADFGLVKALEHSNLTASLSGGILGTPAYVAPEIWHGGEALPQTDVYALACLLFEMINGRSLFNAPTPPAVMLAHFQEPQFPKLWPEEIPDGIEQVLLRALAQEPADRYASAGSLAQALKALTLAKSQVETVPVAVTQENDSHLATEIESEDIESEDSAYPEMAVQKKPSPTGQKEKTALADKPPSVVAKQVQDDTKNRTEEPEDRHGAATASLVLGLLNIFFLVASAWPCVLPIAIFGVIVGNAGRKSSKRSQAIIGLFLNGLFLLVSGILLLLIVSQIIISIAASGG